MRGFYLKGFLKGVDVNAALTLLVVFLLAISSENAVCQTPPPNDNLTNATILTGTDISFTGNLAGSTLESNELSIAFGTNASYLSPYISNSVWWSWTAPVSTVLNLEVYTPPPYPPGEDYVGIANYVFVYCATNDAISPGELLLPSVTNFPLMFNVPSFTYSIPINAGTNYRIQLIGNTALTTYFHLIATNSPLIFKQPLNQTVYPNGSTLFYVETGGLLPRSYQWFFNGTNLPGEIAPILAFNNIDSSRVGSYSCLISNASGSVMSDSATLTISPSNVPPVLKALSSSSNIMSFYLMGESGRAYHIQSSTDLRHWTELQTFPFVPPQPFFLSGNLVFCSNSSSLIVVTNDSPFYRAFIVSPTNTPGSEICINNLHQILIAKHLWWSDTHAPPINTPTFSDLVPYFPHPSQLFCPLDEFQMFDTSYGIQNVQTGNTCEIDPVHHVIVGVP